MNIIKPVTLHVIYLSFGCITNNSVDAHSLIKTYNCSKSAPWRGHSVGVYQIINHIQSIFLYRSIFECI